MAARPVHVQAHDGWLPHIIRRLASPVNATIRYFSPPFPVVNPAAALVVAIWVDQAIHWQYN